MKKQLAIILSCILVILSSVGAFANEQVSQTQPGFTIAVNGETLECSSVIYQNIHYVPLRKVFEKMGAKVFYRNSDRQILALTRDGDMIRHTIGDCIIYVNGLAKVFDVPSILENGETYIPIDMVVIGFCTDSLSYENQLVSIQKYMFHNNFHALIKEVLDVCDDSNFLPEKFQRYIHFHANNPSYSMQEVLYRVNLDLDFSFYENITTIEQPYELSVLVNKYYQLPSNFQQQNLVTMERKYTNGGGQFLMEGEAYEKYVEMSEAARSAGVSMYVVSAYRTEDYQNNLYYSKIRKGGKVYADNYSARAGHSEHQTGLAVDINSTYVSFEYSAAFKWLQQHAHEYGYILRYPRGKEWITGYAYEPWHYRYVGTEAAKIIYEEGITYEEYYVKYVAAKEFD